MLLVDAITPTIHYEVPILRYMDPLNINEDWSNKFIRPLLFSSNELPLKQLLKRYCTLLTHLPHREKSSQNTFKL